MNEFEHQYWETDRYRLVDCATLKGPPTLHPGESIASIGISPMSIVYLIEKPAAQPGRLNDVEKEAPKAYPFP